MERNDRNMNPAAGNLKPGLKNGIHQQGVMPRKTTPPSLSYLEARIGNLEEEHEHLLGEVSTMKEKYYELRLSIEKVNASIGRPAYPPAFGDLVRHDKTAQELGEEMEKLSMRAGSFSGPDQKFTESPDSKASFQTTDAEGRLFNKPKSYQSPDSKGNYHSPDSKATYSTSPHLRHRSTVSDQSKSYLIPPHLRNASRVVTGNTDNIPPNHSVDSSKDEREPLVVYGQADATGNKPGSAPAQLAPATKTPKATGEWMPHYITTLRKLSDDVLSRIPPQQNMVTFSPDFLSNTFGGEMWSPGFVFVKSPGPCVLPNRTYYTFAATTEPYLPKAPGEHGAKLTPFFNKSPEELYPDLQIQSYSDVPMFVERKDERGRLRYVYFGNYSQTRWSDKLDYDSMKIRVPQYVKEHWAQELVATPREEWLTEAMKKHFFPKPEYAGHLFTRPDEDGDESVSSEVERNNTKKMARDVEDYVEELRDWERDASMKTAMINKEALLHAFEVTDIDSPPALRLWWEYLECVDWRKDFYDMLVGLQSRDRQYL